MRPLLDVSAVLLHHPEESQRRQSKREVEEPLGDSPARGQDQPDVRALQCARREQSRQAHVADGAGDEGDGERRERGTESHHSGERTRQRIDEDDFVPAAGSQDPSDERCRHEHLEQEDRSLQEREGREELAEAVGEKERAEAVDPGDEARRDEPPENRDHCEERAGLEQEPGCARLAGVDPGRRQHGQHGT